LAIPWACYGVPIGNIQPQALPAESAHNLLPPDPYGEGGSHGTPILTSHPDA